MIIAEPLWLHTLGQIAGTMLLLELCFVLLLVCVIMAALAYGSWWLHHNVIPILDQYGGKAQHYMGVAIQGSDRVVGGVAEFHGRWEAITTGARVMIFGTRGAKRPVLPASADGSAPTLEPGSVREPIATAPATPDLPDGSKLADSAQPSEAPEQMGLNGHTD
jgi:hypothetical protein